MLFATMLRNLLHALLRGLVSCCPAHRIDDDIEELPGFDKGAALTCGTGADPRQAVDPDLDPLQVAEPLQGIAYVDEQITREVEPRPRLS